MPIGRRTLLALAAAAPFVAAPDVQARTRRRVPRVAYVWLYGFGPNAPYPEQFRARLAQLGWIDGRNVAVLEREAGASPQRLDAVLAALVRSKVDAIVVMGATEAIAARRLTSTIPIVMAAVGDAAMAGLVQSVARPGGNVTGVSGTALPFTARRLALLQEIAPTLTQACVLWNPGRPDSNPEVRAMQDAGAGSGITVQSSAVRTRDEISARLDAMGSDGTQALLVVGDTIVASARHALVARAALSRLPAVYDDRVFVEAGGLMSYGPNLRAMHRRAADYVDQILRGARAGVLPIEQPTKFELVINKATARALGLTIPNSILLQADEVIE